MSSQRAEHRALLHVQGMDCSLTEADRCRMRQMATEHASFQSQACKSS